MICEKCGIENDDKNNYCINCGHQLIIQKYIEVLDEMKIKNFHIKKKKDINKNVVFPTKLSYEDHYPEDSHYETPSSIKFIRDFYTKKKKGYKDVTRKYRG